MSESQVPVVVEQVYDASQKRVWEAITEHEQMIRWFFDNIPEFRAEPGFRTQFDVDAGGRIFRHLWTIIEVIPENKIVYDWRYQDLPGVGKVTFEIFEEGGGTKLRVTNEGIESFPRDIPEFRRESCQAGWEYFIQGNLKNYLENENREAAVTMIRKLMALVLGVIVGSAFNMALITVSQALYPLPEGIDANDFEAFRAHVVANGMPTAALMIVLVAHAGGSFVSGFVCGLVARQTLYIAAAALGILWTCGGVTMLVMLPAPMWFIITDTVLYIPAALFGVMLGGRLTASKRPHSDGTSY